MPPSKDLNVLLPEMISVGDQIDRYEPAFSKVQAANGDFLLAALR